MSSVNSFGRIWARLLTQRAAANDDRGPEVSASRAEVEAPAAGTGWDAYEVWRRMVRDPRHAARRPRTP
jgi:hypothetical protein